MNGDIFMAACIAFAFVALSVACALIGLCVARGPATTDRLLGLYALCISTGCLIATLAIKTGIAAYIDAVLGLAFLGLVSLFAGVSHLGMTAKSYPDQNNTGGK